MVIAKANYHNISSKLPGACRKCGHTGHLFYQCMNHIKLSKLDIADEGG